MVGKFNSILILVIDLMHHQILGSEFNKLVNFQCTTYHETMTKLVAIENILIYYIYTHKMIILEYICTGESVYTVKSCILQEGISFPSLGGREAQHLHVLLWNGQF